MTNRKILTRTVIAVAVVGVVAAMVASTRFVPDGSTLPSPTSSAEGLDPKTWAQANYDSAVVPAITAKVVPWDTLIGAIVADPDSACQQYGQQEEGANSCSFATSITGQLVTGNFDELAVVTASTPQSVTVGFQTGPAITGTALRDASGLVTFGMFQNQTAYQQAGTELNNVMKQEVLANFDPASALGKTYTVVGAFSWDGSGHVTITPISLQVAS